jgi:hypothetical protein
MATLWHTRKPQTIGALPAHKPGCLFSAFTFAGQARAGG